MKTVKLGIIGLGYIGKIHYGHCLKIPEVQVMAVADVSEKALNNMRKAGVKKTFTSYEELLKDPEIDSVVIGLPTHLHLRCAVLAAENGKNIFLEKPIARNVQEAQEIVSAAEKNSVKLMMGYPLRFDKDLCAVKEQMDKGLLGDVVNAHAVSISTGPFFHRAEGHSPVPVPDWWWNQELTGGGVLIDLGSHVINLLRWYFGEITDIKSYLGHRFNMDFEDSALCLAKFTSGTVATIDVGWFSQAYTLKIDFMGSVKNSVAQHPVTSPVFTAIQMLMSGKSKFRQPHLDELKHFVKCIIDDQTPSVTGYDGLEDIKAIQAAYKNQISLL
jgi:myo-inositol 2-dehydrogenase / D-chiro-inositol 1-dehydrogenase